MAQYNADIRIGVTGKTQLNQLETQLKRTQTTLNKLNKSLNLRAKVQTIKLDTRAANTQIKNLEQRINRLGRTVTINVRQNEKPGKGGSSGGSNVTAVVGGGASESLVAAKALRPIAKALTNEAQDLLDADLARKKAVEDTLGLQEKIRSELAKQSDLSKKLNTVDGSTTPQARTANMNRLFGGNVSKAGNKLSPKQSFALADQEVNRLEGSIQRLGKAYRGSLPAVTATSKAYQQLAGDAKNAAKAQTEAAAKTAASADRTKRFRKGAGAGAAVAGLRIPGLEGASAGALGGFAVGGRSGAIGGGLVGLAVDLTKGFIAATSEVTKFNNQLKLSQKALANTVFSGEELASALASIDSISDDFLVPIGDATKQFTKLNAAARASGFGVDEVAEVYRGLAAANVALGGDAERLNGILLATQQVFSKGKVQAEELRGQIGERLAGAFAKFADAAGLSTSELDKALEQGEVSLEDFVKFSKSLLDEYEDDAKRLATEPENAAARLKLAMDDLKKAMGPILQGIGNAFTKMATEAVKALTTMFNAINAFFNKAQMGTAKKVYDGLRNNAVDLQRQKNEIDNNPDRRGSGFGQTSDKEYAALVDNIDRVSTAAGNAYTRLQELKNPLGDLLPSGKPLVEAPEITGGGEGGGGGGGAGGGAGRQSQLPDLASELQYLKDLQAIEQQRTAMGERDAVLRDFRLSQLAIEASREKDIRDINLSDAPVAEKLASIANVQVAATTDLLALKNDMAEFDREELVNNEAILRDLDGAIALEKVYTNEKRIQLETALAIAAVEADSSKSGPQREKEVNKLKELAKARLFNADPINAYMTQLKTGLTDTRQQIADLARTIETELGSALSNAITGLIDGTTTVQEAFGNMFANIGKAFIDMATQMLAQKAILMLLGAFTGGGGQSVGPGLFNLSGGQFGSFAGGGYTGDGPRSGGVDGQGGFPAILHPQEFVYDGFADARNAMGGSGGGGGEEGGGLSSEAINRSFSENSSSITMTNSYMRERSMERESMAVMGGAGSMVIETQVINNVEYASVEQVQAAAAGAAKQARAQVFSDMKNKPSRRAMVGLK